MQTLTLAKETLGSVGCVGSIQPWQLEMESNAIWFCCHVAATDINAVRRCHTDGANDTIRASTVNPCLVSILLSIMATCTETEVACDTVSRWSQVSHGTGKAPPAPHAPAFCCITQTSRWGCHDASCCGVMWCCVVQQNTHNAGSTKQRDTTPCVCLCWAGMHANTHALHSLAALPSCGMTKGNILGPAWKKM